MNTNKGVYNELEQRGFIYQSSDENMSDILDNEKMTVYVGTDPTADSLHIGHLVPMLMLSHFKKFGHNPILLVGGATGMIGDPSFKVNERNLLTEEKVAENLKGIIGQVDKILNNDVNTSIEVVNNYDWFKNMNILEFLRDTGKYFSVNNMLSKDSVKSRIEDPSKGISFTEFSYSLLQAYDFLFLNREKGCNLQIGGSDQWGNIVSGIDLVRKTTGATVHGLTCSLITKSDGTKFGKSEGGNVWLDPSKTSPYKFYQFWINISDEEAYKFIKLYTFLPLDEIDELIEKSKKFPEKRLVQKLLASEITSMIHGINTCKNVVESSNIIHGINSKSIFNDDVLNILSAELDNVIIDSNNFTLDSLFDSLIKHGLFKSKSEIRRLLETNSITLDGENLNNVDLSKLSRGKHILKKGKKTHYIITLN